MFAVIEADARAHILEKRAASVREREANLARLTANLEVWTYGKAVIEFLQEQIRSELAWIERLRRRIHKQKPASRVGR